MKWLLGFLLLCTTTVAEPLPNLPALGAPNWGIDQVSDASFPQALEQSGDYTSALLEWQRIAHKKQGQTRAQALLHVARIQHILNRLQQAGATYVAFEYAFPTHKNLDEVMYWHSRTLPSTQRGKILGAMAQKFPQNLWTKEATYRAVWDMVQEGYTVQNTSDPRAKELVHRLNTVFAHPKKQALLWSIAPGGAYAFIKNWRKAGLTFGSILLFLWALYFALKHRHWPYAVIWGLLFLGTWGYTAVDGYQHINQYQNRLKLLAMAQWFDLHPLSPAKIKEQQTQETAQ